MTDTMRLAALLLAFGVTPTSAQLVRSSAPPSEPRMAYRYLTGYEAVTICYHGQSYSYLDISAGMSALHEAAVKVHEAKHREQYARVGGCDVFNRPDRRSRASLLESEAEAFHAGACMEIAGGMDAAALEAEYVERIRTAYLGGGTPESDVRAAYRRYPCAARPGSGPAPLRPPT